MSKAQSFQIDAEGQDILRDLIIHDRAARDWRERQKIDGADYACVEMQWLLDSLN